MVVEIIEPCTVHCKKWSTLSYMIGTSLCVHQPAYPTSEIRHRTSDIQHPISDIITKMPDWHSDTETVLVKLETLQPLSLLSNKFYEKKNE